MLTVEYLDDGAREWHLTADGGVRTERNDDYRPTVYVGGPVDALRDLRHAVAPDPKVTDLRLVDRRVDLHERDPQPALRVELERVDDVTPFAHEVRHHHEVDTFPPATFRLYNVDFSRQFRYCLETNTEPVPARDLRTLRLSLPEKALADGDLVPLRIDGEPAGDDPATVVDAVARALDRRDPDVLVLTSARLVPLLYAYAERLGVDQFEVGRRPGVEQLAGESTFESYGRVGHSPARFAVPGRAIVDRSNSFMYSKSGLHGLLDLTERSWKPLQETAWGSIGNILTAIQIREAHARGVLIPWNKWDPEAFKSVERLHAADRGGYIFQPEVGVHEDVAEIDFASLYPNIMVEHNISPETVDCDCHDTEDVPGIGYSLCPDRGFIPDVLEPIITDRAGFKRRIRETDDPAIERKFAEKSDALKWILVSCFGYQGYRNAKFGRIECHEAINSFARRIILDAKDTLEAGGWRVVHGIVDSLWVTPVEGREQAPIHELCETISADANIRLEHENDFEWVAFVPKRDSAEGALTKYFGKIAGAHDDEDEDDEGEEGEREDAEENEADGDGEDAFKVRGIEARQRSTPAYVARVQRDFLETFDETRDPAAVCRRLRMAIRDLQRGEVDPQDLVTKTRISKQPGEYQQQTVTAVAVQRAAAEGLPLAPGQDVRYVVVDDSLDGPERVRLPFEDPETYDPDYYATLLVRAAHSVLSPMGWSDAEIRREIRGVSRATLADY